MRFNLINIMILFLVFSACRSREPRDVVASDSYPEMFPDYSGVTIPANIAPLNFRVSGAPEKVVTTITGKRGSVKLVSSDDRVLIPARQWKLLFSVKKIY